MKAATAPLAGLLLAAAAPLDAMPAVLLPSGEWTAATESDRLVLVDQATGQVRIAESDGSGQLSWSPTLRTYLPDVSDIATGLKGDAGEGMTITEPFSNRVVFVELLDPAHPQTAITPPHSGPAALSEVDQGGRELLLASLLEGGGKGAYLETLENLPAGGALTAGSSGFAPIEQLEPLFESPGGASIGVGRIYSTTTKIFLAIPDGGNVDFAIHDTLAGEWFIAPSISDANGDTLVAAWQSGGGLVRFYRLDGGPAPGASLAFTNDPSIAIEGGIGAIMRCSVPGAPDAIAVISKDGSEAKLYQVADSKLNELASFEPLEEGLKLNGLVPLDGIGLVQLDGKDTGGPSLAFASRRWDGSGWEIVDSGTLPNSLPAQTDFATVFYFDSEPFLSEDAVLLGLEVLPDWTSGSTSAPFPASLPSEIYGNDSSGLTGSAPQGFSPPGGSTYLLTNQHRGDLSISALRSNDQILAPSLFVNPPSGPSPTTVEVTALFDQQRYQLLHRNADPSGAWRKWDGSLAVTTSSDWYFRLVDLVTDESGPILTRSWTLPAANLNGTDSDADGVPDYVESERGLDPFGGADSDGDGASDLEEILAGTDPGNDADLPSPRNPVPQGDGVRWLADAGNHTATARISNGEMIAAYDIAGALLAHDDVETVNHPTLGSLRAAEPAGGTTPAQSEWAVLASPVWFDVGIGPGALRNGREIVRLVDVPAPSGPDIVFTPTGTNPAADADGWVTAAQAAYASWHPVSEVTELRPEHTLAALLCEAMIHDQLSALALFPAPAPTLGEFTIFPFRTQDAARTPFDRPLVAALAGQGFDFPTLVEEVDSAIEAPAATELRSAVDAIYAHHIANSDADPSLPMPLPVLREWIAGNGLDSAYSGVATGSELIAAEASIAEIRALSSQAYRPTTTWSVRVLAQGSQPTGVVRRNFDDALVALIRPDGSPFHFEQGIGIREDSVLSVTGFTDLASPTGFPALEVTMLAFSSLPAESARDQDANLLDDEWERFFFGQTGNDAFSTTAGSTFTLLEHYLAGTDPRGGDDPVGSPADLSPPPLTISQTGPGQFEIDFDYPDEYADQLEFIVECSPDLSPGSFIEVAATVTPLGAGEYQITLPPSLPGETEAFYRVRLALP